MNTRWMAAQAGESRWWGDCTHTWVEEMKQEMYAKKMGIDYDCRGRSVADIGGGPTSMLLRCRNRGESYVIDPCDYPNWVRERYRELGIRYWKMCGEDVPENALAVNEAWLYNVLQHVKDPASVITRAKRFAKVIRIFEWLEIPEDIEHVHVLRRADLDRWLGGAGSVEEINEPYCYRANAYYGVFS